MAQEGDMQLVGMLDDALTSVLLPAGVFVVPDLRSIGHVAWLLSRSDDAPTVNDAIERIEIAMNQMCDLGADGVVRRSVLEVVAVMLRTTRQQLVDRDVAEEFEDRGVIRVARVIAYEPSTVEEIARNIEFKESEVEGDLKVLRELGVLHSVRGTNRWALTQSGRRAVEMIDKDGSRDRMAIAVVPRT